MSTARRGIAFTNPEAGPTSTGAEALRALLVGVEVFEVEPDDLAARVTDAMTDPEGDVAFVGVAGGDGTLRAAAEAMLKTPSFADDSHELPLLAIPAGTRNHFARTLGIETLELAAEAAAGGEVQRVDVGVVNGRAFLNNASIGLYPELVAEREVHEERTSKRVAQFIAAARLLRHGHKLTAIIDGVPVRAWVVFVGNGLYGDTPFDVARESLDDGALDLRVVRADMRWARLRVAVAFAVGRLAASPSVISRRASALKIEMAGAEADVALDGELVTVDLPLEFKVARKALPVLVPRRS